MSPTDLSANSITQSALADINTNSELTLDYPPNPHEMSKAVRLSSRASAANEWVIPRTGIVESPNAMLYPNPNKIESTRYGPYALMGETRDRVREYHMSNHGSILHSLI